MRILLLCVLGALSCYAEVRFYVDQRGDWANGKNFGQPGVYEVITAKMVADAGEGWVEVLKPRDPKLGSGTFTLEVNPKSKVGAPPESVLTAGNTVIRLMWRDAGTVQLAVSQLVDFLKYTGGPMLLGDQRRFLKKAILVDNGEWVAQFVASPKNKDAKGRVLVDETTAAVGN
jgi:hypothetical protein